MREVLLAVLWLFPCAALAQADMMQAPGQMRFDVPRNYGWGFTTQPSSPFSAFARPGYGAAYGAPLQGLMPSYVTPGFGNGYGFQSPGQVPSYVTPGYGGASTIRTPGTMSNTLSPDP